MTRRRILPYDPKLKELAARLRKTMTFAEVVLWNELKGKRMMGYDVHRQKPIDQYIVDFYFPDLLLAIEVDGRTHDNPWRSARDETRQQRLEALGVTVLRLNDRDVLTDLNGVIRIIEVHVALCEDPAADHR